MNTLSIFDCIVPDGLKKGKRGRGITLGSIYSLVSVSPPEKITGVVTENFPPDYLIAYVFPISFPSI